MLNIVKFIFENEDDWFEKLSNPPYNLIIKRGNGNTDGLVLFKYNQIESDFNEPIVKEARGIILDSFDGWKVVRYAFNKFFNYGEMYASSIDWNTARVQEKLDGSLISLWYWHRMRKWMVSTSGTIDAFEAEVYDRLQSPVALDKTTFGDMFKSAFRVDLGKLNTDFTYTFELVDPFNHVVKYDSVDVWHIGTRDNLSLKELDVDIGVKKPKEYPLNDLDSVLNAVAKLNSGDKIEHEGFVVVDGNWDRVKIKNALYLAGHYLMGNTISFKRCVDIIGMNEEQEFLAYFPQHLDFFDKVSKIISEFILRFRGVWEEAHSVKVRDNLNKRDYAQLVHSYPAIYHSYLFMKDAHPDMEEREYFFGGYTYRSAKDKDYTFKGWKDIASLVKKEYICKFGSDAIVE